MTTKTRQAGFTLVEVMVALAILAFVLTEILRDNAQLVRKIEQSRMRSVATMLARDALWDLEEQLRKDGFQETEQGYDWQPCAKDQDLWKTIECKAEVRKVELPSPEQLAALAQQQEQAAQAEAAGLAAGSGSGSDAAAPTAGSGLFGMLSMFGGGIQADDQASVSFLGGAGFNIVQDVFKAAIRKVVLSVRWKSLGVEETFDVVYYVTDPDAMNRTIGALGGAGADTYEGAPATGTGSGSSSTGGGSRPNGGTKPGNGGTGGTGIKPGGGR